MKTRTLGPLLLTVLLAAAAIPARAQVCMPAHDCGDVNNDSNITVADALSVLRRAIGLSVNLSCSCTGGDQCPIGGITETGQTACWDPLDNTAPVDAIDCAGTGQDGDLRPGVSNSFVDNGDGTISDQRSTLTWEKLSDDGVTLHDYDNATYQWPGAFQKIQQLNSAAFAGHTDWRLPSIRELTSLIDYSQSNVGGTPSVFPIFSTDCKSGCTTVSCSCTKASSYWTSTTFQASPTGAWSIAFQNGQVQQASKNQYLYVRAVRGGF